eukprot:jgi/Picre1/29384/NNA_004772.t1
MKKSTTLFWGGWRGDSYRIRWEILKLELESRGENVNTKDSVWERERNIAENGILVSLSANGEAKEYTTKDFSPDMLSYWSAVANIDASGPVAPRGKLNLELLKDSDYLKYQELELKHKIAKMEEVEEESMSKAHISTLDSYRAQLAKLLNCGIQS